MEKLPNGAVLMTVSEILEKWKPVPDGFCQHVLDDLSYCRKEGASFDPKSGDFLCLEHQIDDREQN